MREQIYRQLHGTGARGLTPTRFLVAAIVTAVAITILDTEPELPPKLHEFLRIAAAFSDGFARAREQAKPQAE